MSTFVALLGAVMAFVLLVLSGMAAANGALQTTLLLLLFACVIGFALGYPAVEHFSRKRGSVSYLPLRDESGRMYEPNYVPPTKRYLNVALSVCLVVYGAFGLATGGITLPGKRTLGTSFTGVGAFLLYAAMLAAAANLISAVVDHYDVRNNQQRYRKSSRTVSILGFVLLGVSVVVQFAPWPK